ncbi:MAG: glycosyltransferase, partial [Candidatus Omnitrophica bacterium]|nr:glycosyltransferase [Candidatus Omnitrophota bacterium]
MSPCVSIIIITFNYGRFIKDALDSVLDQSFSDYEVIVVDDGSTDNTALIIEKHRRFLGEKLRYFYKENQGVAAARNYGILEARGRYIAFLDADDIWERMTLEKLVAAMEKNPDCGMAYGNVEFYDKDLQMTIGRRFQPGVFPIPYEGKCFDRLYTHGNFIHTSSCILRRSIFDLVGLFDRRFKCGEDLDMWIRVSTIIAVKYLDDVLAKVRRHKA